MIAYLGWGSLFWSPRAFRTHYDDWRIDGPHLPVEFCRVSNNGRLTLVVTDNVEPMPVLWAVATTKDVRAACEHLASREGCPLKRIATARPADASLPYDLKAWMQARGISATIWTGLGPRFANESGRIPTANEAVAYLQSLRGEPERAAKEYVQKAPVQIRTRYRAIFEEKLGWGPQD
jgi:hypothetical protein